MADLLGVTANVLEDAGGAGAIDEDEAVAALLHAPRGRRRPGAARRHPAHFGDRVGDMVAALSDSLHPEPPPWRERKEQYVRSLRQDDPSILRVSLADKLDNVRAIVAAHRVQGDAFWSASTPATTRSGTTAAWPRSSRRRPRGRWPKSSSSRSRACATGPSGRGRSARRARAGSAQLLGELLAGGQRTLVGLAALVGGLLELLDERAQARLGLHGAAHLDLEGRAADSSSSRSSSTPPTVSKARSSARVPLALVMPAA